MNRRLERVRTASFRVALISTGVTAVAFTIISLVVIMYVTSTLTAQVDTRLQSSLGAIQHGQRPTVPTNGFSDPNAPRYGPQLLAWLIAPDGRVLTPDGQEAQLPPQDLTVSSPTTTTLEGTDVRLAGARVVGGYYLVVGQSMEAVNQARSTIIVAELIVGSALLIVVFFGALWVGRRVAAPIEIARQRQMEFTADASHELRTPLSVIEAQTSLALAQDRDPEWYQQAFQRVRGESWRIRKLVDDLLWLARVDSAATEAQAEPIDVAVLAKQAVDRFATVAEARPLELGFGSDAGSHIISASTDWLDRLLGVLLDNACKYTPSGGRVAVSVLVDGGRVRLAVEDSGPGIPAGERGRIFDRFHRATEVKGGAGLGLAIADAVVRHTGGRWEIGASAHLGGASMAVSWPRQMAGKEQARQVPAPPPLEAREMPPAVSQSS